MFRRTQHHIPIIILSDDDDDDDEGDSLMALNDSSVLIVENERNEAGNLRYTRLIINKTKSNHCEHLYMHHKNCFWTNSMAIPCFL